MSYMGDEASRMEDDVWMYYIVTDVNEEFKG